MLSSNSRVHEVGAEHVVVARRRQYDSALTVWLRPIVQPALDACIGVRESALVVVVRPRVCAVLRLKAFDVSECE